MDIRFNWQFMAGVICTLILSVSSAHAAEWRAWQKVCDKDTMTDEVGCMARYTDNNVGNELGAIAAYVLIPENDMVSFQAMKGVVTECVVRVDENAAIKADADDENEGCNYFSAHKLINQMKSGQSMRIRFYLYRDGYEEVQLNLRGLSAILKEY